MSWHRLVKIHKSRNVLIHYTLEGYDNLGVVSTLKKEGDYLILDFWTTNSLAAKYDKVIEAVLSEHNRKDNDKN